MQDFLFNCPKCKSQIQGNENIMGQKHKCIYCNEELTVPGSKKPKGTILGLSITIFILIIIAATGWIKKPKIKEVEVIKEVQVIKEKPTVEYVKKFKYTKKTLKEDKILFDKFKKKLDDWFQSCHFEKIRTKRDYHRAIVHLYKKLSEVIYFDVSNFNDPSIKNSCHYIVKEAIKHCAIQALGIALYMNDDDITLDFREKTLIKDKEKCFSSINTTISLIDVSFKYASEDK